MGEGPGGEGTQLKEYDTAKAIPKSKKNLHVLNPQNKGIT